MLTILHGSDLHFGKPFDAEAAGVFLQAIRDLSPDLIICPKSSRSRALFWLAVGRNKKILKKLKKHLT